MLDFHKILDLFSKEDPMDYCEDFDAVKSVLEYCNQNVKPLNKIGFRGGNENIIENICNRLRKHFISQDYIDQTTMKPLSKADGDLRKIVMFLLLNTDATYKFNLHEGLAHVTEICPLLPKFLLVALIWNLNLEQYFYEVIRYCPCWFTYQYFETATDSLKYIEDPYEVLEKVEQLLKAIIVSIATSKDDNINLVDKKIILNKLNNFAMSFMRQFYTPDAEKFQSFKKLEFFKYCGHAIGSLLDMVLFAFDVYESKASLEPTFDAGIYTQLAEMSDQKVASQSEIGDVIKEHLLKIINVLLNGLQYNVMQVRIDVFIHWADVDLNNTETLQSVIGAKSYLVCERILANPDFNHDVRNQLQSISIRPKTLDETIEEATIGDILRKLDEPLTDVEKKKWLDGLVGRQIALGNEECLESIRSNVNFMSLEAITKIIDYVYAVYDQANDSDSEDDMEVDTDSVEELASILILSFPHLSQDQIIQVIAYEVEKFGKEVDKFECPSYLERATEFLNKISDQLDSKAFLSLCFENPQTMWTKTFEFACNSEIHIPHFCSMAKLTRAHSMDYLRNLLTEALASDKVKEKQFSRLLCSVYFEIFFQEKTEFLKTFINSNVNRMLETQDYKNLLPIVKALNLISSDKRRGLQNFAEATAPVLFMVAQIMDNVRWDLLTFSEDRDELLKNCIIFVQNTNRTFPPVATEKDRKWLSKNVKESLRPITQFYFQKYFPVPDKKMFDEFLIPNEILGASEAETALISIYIRCTAKETVWLGRSDRLLCHMPNMLLTLGTVVNDTDIPNAEAIYRHCVFNYASVLKNCVFPKVIGNTVYIVEIVVKLLKVVANSPVSVYDEIFLHFESLFIDLMKKCAKPVDETLTSSIRKQITKMKDCRGKELLLKNFETLVIENLR